MSTSHTETSKFLSYVLRHAPEAISITLDREGWADIHALVEAAQRAGKAIDHDLVCAVVAGSDKRRFSISEDGKRVRAVQGHSTASVTIRHEETPPPQLLYHGTAARFVDSIMRQGLLPGERHHVHLSVSTATAAAVGQRYGKPVILAIQAKRMADAGFKFFITENGVWLTEKVPSEFIARDNLQT